MTTAAPSNLPWQHNQCPAGLVVAVNAASTLLAAAGLEQHLPRPAAGPQESHAVCVPGSTAAPAAAICHS